MRTSVIIPSLNAPTLARALAAVAAQTEPAAEAIVVGPEVWGEGRGRSKQIAAQAAASEVMRRAEATPE